MNFFKLVERIKQKFDEGELKESEIQKENDLSVFRFVPDGMVYGANPKKKKHTRVSISIPPDVCGENLAELDDWVITLVAIKRDKLDDILKEDEA